MTLWYPVAALPSASMTVAERVRCVCDPSARFGRLHTIVGWLAFDTGVAFSDDHEIVKGARRSWGYAVNAPANTSPGSASSENGPCTSTQGCRLTSAQVPPAVRPVLGKELTRV